MSIEKYTTTFGDIKNHSELQQLLLTLAKHIPDNHSLRNDKNYLYGCQSDVWLSGSCDNNRWRFEFDSNSQLVKGIGKVVVDCFNNCDSSEILNMNFFAFKQIAALLPHERQRGLQFIINRIHTIVGDTQ
jgi:sulfur transfer protein SufE